MSRFPHITNARFCRFIILPLIFILITIRAFTQEPVISPSENIEETLELHAETLEEEYDYTDLFSELEFFLANPMPINIATHDEIRQLFFLNDIQINNLLQYIQDYGKIVTIYELAILMASTAK
jgi:hypothetical protein